MFRAYRCVLMIVVLRLLSGCDSIEAGATSTVVSDTMSPEREPLLQPGDRVRVAVFGEDRITGEYDVDAGGSVALPLTGTINARGVSVGVLAIRIADTLRKTYLKDPKVTASIVSLRPFYVLGEVEKPGEYPYRMGLNVLRALAVAGGPTYRASASTVLIQHQGEPQLREHNLHCGSGGSARRSHPCPERWF